MHFLTIISLYCLPKNVKGILKVRGSDELSSLDGPNRSPAPIPNESKLESGIPIHSDQK